MVVPSGDAKPRSVAQVAQLLAAMGTPSRLRIVQLLLSAHPTGLVVGEIQQELGISPSTLSHHLDKLRNEQLVTVERKGTFLRYRANASVLGELLGFFYSECCTRNAVIDPQVLVSGPQAPSDFPGQLVERGQQP